MFTEIICICIAITLLHLWDAVGSKSEEYNLVEISFSRNILYENERNEVKSVFYLIVCFNDIRTEIWLMQLQIKNILFQ